MTRRAYPRWLAIVFGLLIGSFFLPKSVALVVMAFAMGIAFRCAYERGDLKE